MLNLFFIDNNIKNSAKNDLRYAPLEEIEDILHFKFNSYNLKGFEYVFYQFFSQYEVFRFEDIKSFVQSYFNIYYFANDISRHLLSFFCFNDPENMKFQLKSIEWSDYFNSDIIDVREFLKTNPPQM